MGEPKFTIGLVGAGAISAGAYTAGVVDFLVDALDSWYGAKEKTERIPRHDVELSVFSGASAGGITAAVAAGFLGSDQPPVRNPESESKLQNKLFDCWVQRIDIQSLLELRDIKNKEVPLVSLLDSSVLTELADAGLDVASRAKKRLYVAEEFLLRLTLTNLRGVPYFISLNGGSGQGHPMSLHADYADFCFNETGQGANHSISYIPWNALNNPKHTTKNMLKNVALATGAFPVGLAPRHIEYTLKKPGKIDWYSSRKWPVLRPNVKPDGTCQCIHEETIPPAWGAHCTDDYVYSFLSVDGGVMNNEPLELARQALAGSGLHNPRSGENAIRAVLLIDPFPGDLAFDPDWQPPTRYCEDALFLVFRLEKPVSLQT